MSAATLLSPRYASRGPPGPPKKGQGGPKTAQDGPKMVPESGDHQRENPARYVLEPSWAHLGANSGHIGLNLARPHQHRRQFTIQVAVFKPSRPQQDLRTATLQVFWWSLGSPNLQKSLIFLRFFKVFAILPSCHIPCPPQPFQAQDLPQEALLDPPRRAKEAPR